MITDKILNPYALLHLPCSDCGKPAKEINLEPILPGGTVAYRIYSKWYGMIVGRKCSACAEAERRSRDNRQTSHNQMSST